MLLQHPRQLGELRRRPLGRHPRLDPARRPGGWNDLDSLDVGNGEMDGLTKAERQSYATLWAIAKSPLYTGDDLTRLDSYGLSLLTNREVIAINQGATPPARPVTPPTPSRSGPPRTRRHLHRRPVQPRRRARRRHRRLVHSRLHRQGRRP